MSTIYHLSNKIQTRAYIKFEK